MTRSANEISGLAASAARGAGAPPAQAVQFGAAAVQHLAQGRALADLDQALENLPAGPILSLPVDFMRIAESAAGGTAVGILDGANGPLARSYAETLPWQAALRMDGVVGIDLTKPAARACPLRIDLPEAAHARWSALAARLLVPESDASRLTGAGAGISDND